MLQCPVAAVAGFNLHRQCGGAFACHAVYQTFPICKKIEEKLASGGSSFAAAVQSGPLGVCLSP